MFLTVYSKYSIYNLLTFYHMLLHNLLIYNRILLPVTYYSLGLLSIIGLSSCSRLVRSLNSSNHWKWTDGYLIQWFLSSDDRLLNWFCSSLFSGGFGPTESPERGPATIRTGRSWIALPEPRPAFRLRREDAHSARTIFDRRPKVDRWERRGSACQWNPRSSRPGRTCCFRIHAIRG